MDLLTLSLAVAVMLLVILLAWLYLSKVDLRKHLEEISGDHNILQNNYHGLQQRLAEADRQLNGFRQLEIDKAKLTEVVNNNHQQLVEINEQLSHSRQKCDNQQEQLRQLTGENSTLRTQVDERDKRLGERDVIEQRFRETFKALSGDVLTIQGKIFSDSAVAKIVKPLEEKVRDLDRGLHVQQNICTDLKQETQMLANALKKPEIRGRFGEILLERILELSGLEEGITYELQGDFRSEDGKKKTPDVIIHIDNEHKLILDSKVSLKALQEAYASDDQNFRQQALDRHVDHVKKHVKGLADKDYPDLVKTTIDAVIMVMPEFAFLQAVERYPDLVEDSLKHKVIVAPPQTLLALLKTINMKWRETQFVKEAAQVSDLGKKMHDTLAVFAGHYFNLGKSLKGAVDNYNKGVSSWDRNVASATTKFKEFNVPIAKTVPTIDTIDTPTSTLQKLHNIDKETS